MKRSLAAILFAWAALCVWSPAMAQDANAPAAAPAADSAGDNALNNIMTMDIPPEKLALGAKLVALTGTGRLFDELLPNIADQAKNNFIRANPQMQLGIISVVDKVAVQLVSRRKELDTYLARVWAAGFSEKEMQDLIDFYSSDTGKKFATEMPKILAVQTAAAQAWGKSVSEELTKKVQAELRAAMDAEQQALQNDVAGPAATPAPAPAQ